MPYNSNKSLPQYVKKYSEKVQSQWRHVFNSVFKKTNDEGRAFQAANSVLKKRMEGQDALIKNERSDIMQAAIDNFLGNLK